MAHSAEVYNGYTIEIHYDTDPISPRQDSNIGKMICSHSRYNLGDKHDYRHDDYGSWEELEKQLVKDFKNDLILPLYLYDHSGITMNTTGFNCRWHSGQVGFIIVDRKGLEECCGIKRIKKSDREKILKWLEGEVRVYDQYLTGDVYGYVITDEDGDELDSCWGYYGEEYAIEEARGIIDYYNKEKVA